MKAWRALLMLPVVLLSGCLVTLREPLVETTRAPAHLLGIWEGRDEWGEERFLEITAADGNRYEALMWRESLDDRSRARRYPFVVSHHGQRWYFTLPAPERLGGNQAFGGFELTDDDELVVYNLDAAELTGVIGSQRLQGEAVVTEEGDGVLLDSPQSEVLEFFDDPANSDLFVEVARFNRVQLQED